MLFIATLLSLFSKGLEMQTTAIISIAIYKIFSLFTGLVLCCLGFLLFKQSQQLKTPAIDKSASEVSEEKTTAGDINIAFGKHTNMTLKNSTPGAILVFMGGMVVGATIWKGFDYNLEHYSQKGQAAVSEKKLSLSERLGKKTD
jgi:uncharacterized membrane protein